MNVMIVEDEVLVSEYLKGIVEQNGIRVVAQFESASESIDFLKSNKPDLCLLDIRLLNGESGIDVGMELSKLGIPFIFITANNDLATIKEAVKAKPVAYLSKPFNERDVLASIEIIKALSPLFI